MQPFPVPDSSDPIRASGRAPRWWPAPIAASANGSAQVLAGLRWQVREAEGGAEAWAEAEAAAARSE